MVHISEVLKQRLEAPAKQPLKARGLLHGKEVEATVVNPGDWFGKVWLLYVEDCVDPPLYAVEADNMGDAIDTFIESDHGKAERLDTELEGGDYGYEVNPGDVIGGVTIEKKGWVNLKGEFTDDPEKGKYLTDPDMSGQGQLYDGDNIRVVGDEGGKQLPWPCRYYDPNNPGTDIPAAGLSPLNYCHGTFCDMCEKPFWPNEDGATRDHCSNYCEQDKAWMRGGEMDVSQFTIEECKRFLSSELSIDKEVLVAVELDTVEDWRREVLRQVRIDKDENGKDPLAETGE